MQSDLFEEDLNWGYDEESYALWSPMHGEDDGLDAEIFEEMVNAGCTEEEASEAMQDGMIAKQEELVANIIAVAVGAGPC